jgi:hypothetical protein
MAQRYTKSTGKPGNGSRMDCGVLTCPLPSRLGIQLPQLAAKEVPDFQDGMDAVVGIFQFVRGIKQPGGLPRTQSPGERHSLPGRMTATKPRPTVSIIPVSRFAISENFMELSAPGEASRIFLVQ